MKATPWPYHLANIIVHIINTWLVYAILRRFFKREAGFLGAALFAVHPIHVEAVTWISGRGYLIIALFTFLCYLLYRKATYPEEGATTFNWRYYVLCLLLFCYFIVEQFNFFALVLPLFVFSDLTFGKWRRNWKWWIPLFVIVAFRLVAARATVVMRVEAVAKEMGVGSKVWDPQSWSNPLYNMAYSLFSHLQLLVWPQNLTIYHEPPIITRTLLNVELAAMALLVIALPFIFKRARPVFFALGVYAIFFIPTYSPILISWLVAERYAYVPSIALSICMCFAHERIVARNPARRRMLLTGWVIVCCALSVRTVIRNEDWKTPQRFWLSTALVSPDSPRSHNNLGDAYAQEENFAMAITAFKNAITIKPDYADAYHNLANIYQHIGNVKEAIPNYEKAIALNPSLYESYANLGVAYLNVGEVDKAIKILAEALRLRPDDRAASDALAFAIQKKNEK